jgi:hypothetical protein
MRIDEGVAANPPTRASCARAAAGPSTEERVFDYTFIGEGSYTCIAWIRACIPTSFSLDDRRGSDTAWGHANSHDPSGAGWQASASRRPSACEVDPMNSSSSVADGTGHAAPAIAGVPVDMLRTQAVALRIAVDDRTGDSPPE